MKWTKECKTINQIFKRCIGTFSVNVNKVKWRSDQYPINSTAKLSEKKNVDVYWNFRYLVSIFTRCQTRFSVFFNLMSYLMIVRSVSKIDTYCLKSPYASVDRISLIVIGIDPIADVPYWRPTKHSSNDRHVQREQVQRSTGSPSVSHELPPCVSWLSSLPGI